MKRANVWIVSVLMAMLLMASVVYSAEGDTETLNFGVVPLESAKIMYKQFKPLTDYLSKELGCEVKLVISKDYQSAMDALGTNQVQIAYLTPTVYPKCEKQNPKAEIRPIVRFLEGGAGIYHSCIIVPADSEITKLEQLKGKVFAFGNPDSTASHLMPRAMLVQSGLDVEKDLAEIKFLDSHSNVATAVKMKQVAAGGVKESVAEKFVKDGDVKIIARSKDIPEFPICVNNHVSKERAEKIVAALLKLKFNKENAEAPDNAILTAINAKYTGCELAKAADYDTIRDMVKSLYGDKFYERVEEKPKENVAQDSEVKKN